MGYYDEVADGSDWGSSDYRSTKGEKKAGKDAAKLREDNRVRGKAGYGLKERAAKEGLDRFVAGTDDRQGAIRQGAAKGYADAAGGVYGGAGGGGMISSLGQLSMDAGLESIRQTAADDERRMMLETSLGDAQTASAEYDMTAGSAADDHAKAMSKGNQFIEAEFRESQGSLDDNEDRVFAAVRQAAAEARAAGSDSAAEAMEDYWFRGKGLYRINNT